MPKTPWSITVGNRGNRVRVYERELGGTIYRSISITGKEDRRSLGHRDKKKAVQQAHELVARLLAEEKAFEQETLTVGMLVKLYLESPAHRDKKARTQKDDQAKLDRLRAFFGADRRMETLTASDVRRYSRARSLGDRSLVGAREGKPVGARTIEADVVALQTALNWAVKERDQHGRRLLRENPLHGVSAPREKNPKRPVMTHDEYLALLEVASEVHPMLRVALIVAEGTGRRISAWYSLRWEDVNFHAGEIRWRAEHDKKGYEDVRPMTEAVRDALLAWRRECPEIGEAWIFPSPTFADRRCSRHLLDAWLRRAYAKAKRTPMPGGMWHPLRRKWATERKGYPVKDVAEAGGWRDPQTMLRSYQQADPATVRQVILHPTHRLEAIAAGE